MKAVEHKNVSRRMPEGRLVEIRRGWHIVMAAMVGVGTGISGLLLYSVGLFAADLAREIGLSRTMFGFSLFAATLAIGCAMPFIGFLIDRYGVTVPTVCSALLLALGFVALGTVVHSVTAYVLALTFIGFFGAGSGPVAFTRVVSSWFKTARGLALGATMMGIGIAGAVVPVAIGAVISSFGWRTGFLALAAAAVTGTLPTVFVLREMPVLDSVGGPTRSETDAAFATIRRDPIFWRLLITFGVMSLAFTGLLPHLVPMLTDGGLNPASAAGWASVLGISVIVSRVVIGWLLDVVTPTVVAAAVCFICAAGVLVVAYGGVAMAPVAAIALGCTIGAEIDMLGFFTARYFGMLGFGRAYAWQYCAFIVASGVGPLWIGALFDSTGTYVAALTICAVGMVLCAAAFATLPAPRTPTVSRLE